MKSHLHTLGATNLSETERQIEDFYATDPKALEMLLEKETFNHEVWECTCGTGWLSNVLINHGYDVKNSDIIQRNPALSNFELLDFMTYNEKNTRDIITNPPYKLTTKFVRHALDVSEEGVKICMFLRLTFLEGQQRRELIFDKDPPYRVYPFSKRILVAKDGVFPKGSAVAYCWVEWIKGYKGNPEII